MVIGITIQNIDILRLNINMIEEIIMHKTVIAFGCSFGKPTYSSILKVTTSLKLTSPLDLI